MTDEIETAEKEAEELWEIAGETDRPKLCKSPCCLATKVGSRGSNVCPLCPACDQALAMVIIDSVLIPR